MQRNGVNGRRIVFEILCILLLAALVFVDQALKIYIKDLHYNQGWIGTEVIRGFFYITYAENTGSAWSFLADKEWAQLFFKILTSVALVVFAVFYVYLIKKKKIHAKFPTLLFIAGTIGNFIDRLSYNYVIDFIGLRFWGYNFPVFNFADSCLCVGIIWLIIYVVFFSDFFKSKKGIDNKESQDNNSETKE